MGLYAMANIKTVAWQGEESGARALGRRPWGRISTLLQSFKNTF